MFVFLHSVSAQTNIESVPVQNIEGFIVPVEFLDPSYPVLKNTGNNDVDLKLFQTQLRIYSKETGKFPNYISTGDPEKDYIDFVEEKNNFLLRHPYFPQMLFTGNNKLDLLNFELWYKAWFEFYPEKAKQVTGYHKKGRSE